MIFRIFGYLFGVGAVFFLLIAGAIAWYVSGLAQDLPDYEVLAKYEPPVMTRIHAADGQLVAEYAHERRLYLPIQAIPDRVKAAFLSAEDKNFYHHSGVDPFGIVRAMLTERAAHVGRPPADRRLDHHAAGGEELPADQRALARPQGEGGDSRAPHRAGLDSKDKILELYLNEIFLGLGAYGVAAASLSISTSRSTN
jgi:penicillin-binding protein 1A